MKQRFTFTQEQREAILKPLGEMIYVARNSRGFSRKDIANGLGKTIDTVRKVENGQVAITLSDFFEIFFWSGFFPTAAISTKRINGLDIGFLLLHEDEMKKEICDQACADFVALLYKVIVMRREGLKMSQQAFSKMAGISLSTTKKIASNSIQIKVISLIQIFLRTGTFINIKLHVSRENGFAERGIHFTPRQDNNIGFENALNWESDYTGKWPIFTILESDYEPLT